MFECMKDGWLAGKRIHYHHYYTIMAYWLSFTFSLIYLTIRTMEAYISLLLFQVGSALFSTSLLLKF